MATPRIRFLRPFTTRLFNPLSRRFAGRLPAFGIITYVGRRSGKIYRTPLNVFRHDGQYIVALTYGADVQWVKNVLAAGRCELETMGRVVSLRDPAIFVDQKASLMPLPVRFFLRLIRVSDFMRLTPDA